MRIGLLEDNRHEVDYLTYILAVARGHEVYPYSTGDSLLQHLFIEREPTDPLPYDVVMIDLRLSGSVSGLAVLAYLHQTQLYEQLPIVVCSAASLEQLHMLAKQYPTIRILRKPFKLRELLQVVENVQARHPRQVL